MVDCQLKIPVPAAIALMFSTSLSAQVTDYPGAPTEHGSVIVELSVNASGNVTECEILRPSAVESLDSAVCPLAAYAWFNPALDSQNQAIESQHVMTFHFIIPHAEETAADLPIGNDDVRITYNPRREAAQQANGVTGPGEARPAQRNPIKDWPAFPERARRNGDRGKVTVSIDVSPEGRPELCSVIRSSGSEILDDATCEFVSREFSYAPGKDYFGKHVGDVDIFTMTWGIAE